MQGPAAPPAPITYGIAGGDPEETYLVVPLHTADPAARAALRAYASAVRETDGPTARTIVEALINPQARSTA